MDSEDLLFLTPCFCDISRPQIGCWALTLVLQNYYLLQSTFRDMKYIFIQHVNNTKFHLL